jgi:hypothetical protein
METLEVCCTLNFNSSVCLMDLQLVHLTLKNLCLKKKKKKKRRYKFDKKKKKFKAFLRGSKNQKMAKTNFWQNIKNNTFSKKCFLT